MKPETKRWIFDITVWTASLVLALGGLGYDALTRTSFAAADRVATTGACVACTDAGPVSMSRGGRPA